MNRIRELITILGLTEDQAIKAILSQVGPPVPSAARISWTNNTAYGNSAPSNAEIWAKFTEADFRCRLCGSQLRLTLDHHNGNAKDDSATNLQVLCFACNRRKSKRGTVDHDHGLRIYQAVVELFKTMKRIPTLKEIRQLAGVKQIGGSTYKIRYFLRRLEQESPDDLLRCESTDSIPTTDSLRSS